MMMVTTHKTRYEQKDAQTQTIGLDLNDNLDSAHYPSMCSLCREHNSKHHIPRLEMTFKWVPSTLTAKAQTQNFGGIKPCGLPTAIEAGLSSLYNIHWLSYDLAQYCNSQ